MLGCTVACHLLVSLLFIYPFKILLEYYKVCQAIRAMGENPMNG
jgi:hypothetical protein